MEVTDLRTDTARPPLRAADRPLPPNLRHSSTRQMWRHATSFQQTPPITPRRTSHPSSGKVVHHAASARAAGPAAQATVAESPAGPPLACPTAVRFCLTIPASNPLRLGRWMSGKTYRCRLRNSRGETPVMRLNTALKYSGSSYPRRLAISWHDSVVLPSASLAWAIR